MTKLIIFLMVALLLMGPAFAAVNINTATEQELSENLKNVGPVKAAAIVEHREKHGKFESVDDLTEVKGIGKSTVEMNREQLTTGAAKTGSE